MNDIIYGSTIRARKVYGHHGWLVYKLLDPDKQDRAGNRSAIDYAKTRRDAIEYIYNLDDIGVLQHGKDKLSEY